MKNEKQLAYLYASINAKTYKKTREKDVIDFNGFLETAKAFIKEVREGTVCGMKVSRSGKTRHFNFEPSFNLLLNGIYNERFDWSPVKVTGCGMDMHWHLKYRVCEALLTKKEIDRWLINSACSNGRIY